MNSLPKVINAASFSLFFATIFHLYFYHIHHISQVEDIDLPVDRFQAITLHVTTGTSIHMHTCTPTHTPTHTHTLHDVKKYKLSQEESIVKLRNIPGQQRCIFSTREIYFGTTHAWAERKMFAVAKQFDESLEMREE